MREKFKLVASQSSLPLFSSILLLGMLAIAALWLLEEYFQVISIYDRIGYGASLIVGIVCLLLSNLFKLINTAKVVAYFYVAAYLLTLSVIGFVHSADSGNIFPFARTLMWVPILYLVGFLFLSTRQAVICTITVYVLLLGLLVVPYFDWINIQSNALKALSLNIILSNAVYILCMFGVMRLKQTQQDSELHALNMEKAANNDGLLGIGNRRLLQAELNSRVAERTPFSLLLIDIDFFKSINDVHGHLVGDDILREITRCMEDNLRPDDTIGRWGGEEFLVIANGAKFEVAVNLAERLRKAVEKHPFAVVGKVTISIGVTQFRPDQSVSQTFAEADKALYRAKNSGRNQVVAVANTQVEAVRQAGGAAATEQGQKVI